MTITTICTDRKTMVARISELTGIKAEYMKTPTYAYRVGSIIVERDGSINASEADALAIIPMLKEHGYLDADFKAPEESGCEAPEVEVLEGEAEAAEPIACTCVSIPIQEFNPVTLMNLLIMLYARQDLIAAMTQSSLIAIDEELVTVLRENRPDSILKIQELLNGEIRADLVRGVAIEDERFTIALPYDEARPTGWMPAATLLLAMADRAKAAKHVSAKRISPLDEEMKYFCRNWLIQLGLGTPEKREQVHALIGHLRGYAAFRSAEQMTAHKAKHAERRRAQRESDGEVNTDGK